MPTPLFKTYIWLVDTIYRAGKITLKEINTKWLRSDFSYGKKIPLRTFHNWRARVEETFDIIIECDKSFNEYYIENVDDLQGNNLQAWLLNSFTVSNLLQESSKIKNRIALENVPSGAKFLTLILESLCENTKLEITYQSYHQEKSSTFTVSPYFLKLFQQRWYLIALSDHIRIYALDRMQLVEKMDEKFEFPEGMDVESYFAESFGIINDDTQKPSTIQLKFSNYQANYIRSLPLHHSQIEIEITDEYVVFEYFLKPMFDFEQKLLSFSETVEVISPDWYRNLFAERLDRMREKYNVTH